MTVASNSICTISFVTDVSLTPQTKREPFLLTIIIYNTKQTWNIPSYKIKRVKVHEHMNRLITRLHAY